MTTVRRRTIRGWFAVGAIALMMTAACQPSSPSDPLGIEVHRSPTCECCGEYEAYLEGEGFEVDPVIRDDVATFKEDTGVPDALGSCHTAIVDGYFVEGHVPVEAIHRLLDERPDIDGIALPGMPPGTPGMAGEKDATWIVYAVSGDEVTEFAVY